MKKILIYLLVSLMSFSTFTTYAISAEELEDDVIVEDELLNEEETVEDQEELVYPETSKLDEIEEVDGEEIIDVEDDYFATTKDFDFSNNNYYGSGNPLTASAKGTCTWYVWGRVKQLTGISLSPIIEKWANSSYSGMGMSDKPSNYSIMMAYSGNVFMHTAFVEYWDGTNITISECNYGPSGEQNKYHEFSGTLEQFISTYSYYNGWTSVKFIPLIEAPFYYGDSSYIEDIKSEVNQTTGELYAYWKSGTLVGNDYFEINIYDEDGNVVDTIQTTNNNFTYQIKDYDYHYFNIQVIGTRPTQSQDVLFQWHDPSIYGFEQDERGTRYKHWEGYYLTNEWIKVDSVWYYFDADSYMVTGWKKIDGKWYYMAEDGVMQKGLIQIDGEFYYLNSDMKTGWQVINGVRYYFNASGVALDGWQAMDGYWYYFDGCRMVTEWKKIDDVWYYFNAYGQMQRNQWLSYKGNWYYLNSSGESVDGWQKLNNKWYYFNDLKMVTGWNWIDDSLYCFNDNGVMLKSQWLKYANSWAYLSSSGAALDGWQSLNSKWYYFDGCAMVTGWKTIDEKWYYFDTNGSMLKGWQFINNKWYYFNSSAVVGFNKINDKWYYFDTNAAMVSSDTLKIDGDTYYFTKNVVNTGWINTGSSWKYVDPNTCQYVKNDWRTINSKRYHFDQYGFMQVDWFKVGDDWYFANKLGVMLTNTWVSDKGYKFYMGADGTMSLDWKKIDGKWYYFSEVTDAKHTRGGAVTGWYKDNDKWYCFDEFGVMLTGWVKDSDGEYYYMESSGVMATSKWISSNGYWYYVNENGKMERNKWVDGNWYYVLNDGRMARNQWITDPKTGKKYYVGNNGKWVPEA